MNHRRDENSNNVGHFLWLSDLHFDPFYGFNGAVSHGDAVCNVEDALSQYKFGKPGCDAPISLLNEVLSKSQQVMGIQQERSNSTLSLDFVLVTGDFCRHGTDLLSDGPVQETQAILSNVTDALRFRFPSVPIIPTPGNNDFTPDYYIDLEKTAGNNTLLNMMTESFSKFLLTQEEKRTYLKGGYFARNMTDKITIISLNTIIYSIRHQPDQAYLLDPFGQFEWLAEQLQVCKMAGRKVYIAGHIPTTIGSFRHSQLWHEKYIERYYSVLKNWSGNIAGQLFGHLHTDEFRLITLPVKEGRVNDHSTTAFPLLMASSVTPIYGSNPSFRIVLYEKDTARLLDYDTYYIDLEASTNGNAIWIKTESFQEAYQVPDLTGSSLKSIVDSLSNTCQSNQSLWEVFLSRQSVYSSPQEGQCDKQCRIDWLCTLRAISRKEFDECRSKPKKEFDECRSKPKDIIFGVVLLAVVLLALVVTRLIMKQCNKRRRYDSSLQGVQMTTTENGNVTSDASSNGSQNSPLPEIT